MGMDEPGEPGEPEDESDFWTPFHDGDRDPVEIIYVAEDTQESNFDLSEIQDWGEMTGMWNIRLVPSCQIGLAEHAREPADLMILLNCGRPGAKMIADAVPSLPLAVAAPGGFGTFDFSQWPSQVVVAQWAAPRPTEFADGVADALRRVHTHVAYENPTARIEIFQEIKAELLERLSEYPEDRFRIRPELFEELVAELLSRMGYSVRVTPRSGDKGRDVIAHIQTPAAPLLMLVECKRYAAHRLVGPEPITRLWYRLFDDHANMAMVVTTSGFQPIARQTARDRGYQIALKDGEDFIAWIRGLKNP